MPSSTKTQLSHVLHQLQEQVDIIEKYLAEENLPGPSFIPSEADSEVSQLMVLPPHIEAARNNAYSLSWGLNTLLANPQNHVTDLIFHRSMDVPCLRIVIEKDIASTIPIDSPGVNIKEIAEKVKLPEEPLLRILRKLCFTGVFREPSPRVIAHTTYSAFLKNKAHIWKDFYLHLSDESFKVAGYLPEALNLWGFDFDKVQRSELKTAFNLAFRTDQHMFEWLYSPENFQLRGSRFGRAMMGVSRNFLSDANQIHDWSVYKKGDKIVDVGGGVGYLGSLIKKKVNPGVEVIVQDLPEVIAEGKEQEFGNQLTFQAHDFFTTQPVKGAKVYTLRFILHDWPDTISRTILSNIVKAMDKESKVLVLDFVWPSDEFWATGKDDETIIEAHDSRRNFNESRNHQMLQMLGSKERTTEEWKELLEGTGLKLSSVRNNPPLHSVLELVLA